MNSNYCVYRFLKAVLCGLKLEVKVPEHNTSDSGEIDIRVQSWPLCSPDAKVGAASDAALRLGQSLFRVCATRTRAASMCARLCAFFVEV